MIMVIANFSVKNKFIFIGLLKFLLAALIITIATRFFFYLFNCFLGFFNSYFYNYFRLRIPQENNQKSTQNNLFSFTRPERGLSQTHCKKNSMLTLNCQATNSQEKIKSRFEKPIFNKKILWHVKP